MERAVWEPALVLARQSAALAAPAGARIEAEPGALDPRLKLAACARVEAFWVRGQAAIGRTRVGLRCADAGAARWTVFLPVNVRAWAPGVVTVGTLPAGTRLTAEQLKTAEVDWSSGDAFKLVADLLGRTLARPMMAGQALHKADVQARQWFVSGQTVQIVGQGLGFAITSQGVAMSHGVEGSSVRVRTESGRIVVARPVGSAKVEIAL
jgi:flagellar basal body P-ring formation protein FlgA